MQLFDDALPTKARLTDREIDRLFEETFWPHAWGRGTPPMLTEKAGAKREYRMAIRKGDEPEFLEKAIKAAAARFRPTDPQYRPSVRKWLHNGGQHDQPDTIDALKAGIVKGVFHGESLECIASNVKRAGTTWARCRYPRDVLEQCVREKLITIEQMEAAL